MTNEEKYKTPEGRNKAFRRFCDNHICNDECPCHKGNAHCNFLWLALEAEEEKLLSCPFCGGEAEVVRGHPMSNGSWVRCKKCNVLSMLYYTKAEAIAAWNRRAK